MNNDILQEIEKLIKADETQKSIELFEKALDLYQEIESEKYFSVRYRYALFLMSTEKASGSYIKKSIELLNDLRSVIELKENSQIDLAILILCLGRAYELLSKFYGNHSGYLRTTINYYEKAAEMFKSQDNHKNWAAAKASIGYAYGRLGSQNRVNDIEKAVCNIRDSLEFYTKTDHPDDYWDKMKELARLKSLIKDDSIWDSIWEEYDKKHLGH